MMEQERKATILLILVAMMWGLTFPLIKDALQDVSPYLFVLLRLCLAALLILPLVIKKITHFPKSLLIGAMLLGLFSTASYLTQTIGLETVSSANSAFITALNVVIIPFIAPVFKLGKLQFIHVVAVILTIAGIFILTGAQLTQLSAGDGWTLLTALSYAAFVICLQCLTKRKIDTWTLVFLQIIFGIPLAGACAWLKPFNFHPALMLWVALIFCSLFASVLTIYLQVKFQRYVSVTKAGLIYAFEPVFATIFAYFLNHEPVTVHTFVGGGLVVLGFLTVEYVPKLQRRG